MNPAQYVPPQQLNIIMMYANMLKLAIIQMVECLDQITAFFLMSKDTSLGNSSGNKCR